MTHGEHALLHEMLIDEFDSIFEKRWTVTAPMANLPDRHDVCRDFFDAAGFSTEDPAGVDPDSLAADLGALHDAIGRDSLDDVYELLQLISSHLCRSPVPDVRWAVLE
jgi:hypothetical protein